MTPAVDVRGNPRACPYPGLRPFASDESEIFFGRERQTDALLAKLRHRHFLAVVGSSGCGKSSLVRAGMMSALATGFMVDAGPQWRMASMRPGPEPFRRLARALLQPEALGPERKDDAEALVYAELRRGRRGLLDVLDDTPLPEGTNLLVLVDQFEEIFRFREQVARDEADAFVGMLLGTVGGVLQASERYRVYLAITMRSDFVGDCATFAGFPELVTEGQFLTPRLLRDECQAAIEGPARVHGGRIDPALVNRLMNDFGPDPDRLPLLQHVLMRMWVRALEGGRCADGAGPTLTVEDYTSVGGIGQALSNHADEVLGELSKDDRRIAEIMFRRLCERAAGKRDLRTPARVRDVAAVAAVDPADVIRVAGVFRRPDRSFLVPATDVVLTPDDTLDIGHESLIGQWATLRRWAEDESRIATQYRRLVETAALYSSYEAEPLHDKDLERARLWRDAAKPTEAWAARYGTSGDFTSTMRFLDDSVAEAERQLDAARAEEARRLEEKQRQIERAAKDTARRRVLMALLAAVTIFAIYARRQASLLDSARINAEESAKSAKIASTQAAAESEKANAAKDAVEKANGRLEQQTRELEQQTHELEQQKRELEEQKQRLESTLAALTTTQSELARKTRAGVATAPGPSVVPELYVQIRDDAQRVLVARLRKALQPNVNVPAAEVLKSGPPDRPELRYFRQDEADDAKKVLDAVAAVVPDVQLKYVAGLVTPKRLQFELWLTPDTGVPLIAPDGKLYCRVEQDGKEVVGGAGAAAFNEQCKNRRGRIVHWTNPDSRLAYDISCSTPEGTCPR